MNEDEANLSDALIGLTEVVEGKRALSWLKTDHDKVMTANAIERVLAYVGRPEKVDLESLAKESVRETREELYTFFNKRGLTIHGVELKKGWSQDALGAMIAMKKNGDRVALIPDRWGVYHYQDYNTGRKTRVNRKNEEEFESEAFCFFRQFENKSLTKRDLLYFMFKSITANDYLAVAVFGMAATLVSMVTPMLIRLLFANVGSYQTIRPIISFLVFMLSASISVVLFRVVQTQVVYRMSAKVDRDTRGATMKRLLSLPTDFYKKHATGEIAKRIQIFPMLCNALVTGVFTTGLMMVLSFVYLYQVYRLGGRLVRPVTIIVLVYLVLTAAIIVQRSKVYSEIIEYTTRDNALLVSMMNGIQTLKVTASEKRMYTKWLRIFKNEAMAQYQPGFLVVYGNVFLTAVMLIGMLVIYFVANETSMYADSYIAFTSVYGMIMGTLMGLQDVVPNAAMVVPILDNIDVFFRQLPEEKRDVNLKEVVPSKIEFDNVSFKYDENLPLVIKNLNLTIHDGEYLAIVGKSGCGKSTIMRLILGFEECTYGNIYVSGININNVDKRALRRQYGVVMQDSKLFSGSIFKNIAISNPGMSEEEAWEAARKAGIADDIEKMPMKMNTLVDENASCISGGQKQRIIIARALAGNPKLVLFDEATSALDNVTQKVVSDSLDQIKCTRVVIAHRLSTIKNCDRIIMIEDGPVAESGTYEELIAKNGKFAQMVKRQQL